PRSEQRIDERREAIGFADDDRGVLAHRRIAQLPCEQLGGAAQSAERIFDLVRQLTNHQAAAADLREQRGLARDALMLSRIGELDDEAGGCRRIFERRHRAIDDELAFAVDGSQRQLAARVRTPSLDCALHDALEPGGVRNELFERATARLIATDAEQRLGRYVQKLNAVSLIDDQDARAEPVENA